MSKMKFRFTLTTIFFILLVAVILFLSAGQENRQTIIKQQIAEAGYCQTQEDCTIIPSQCPFDCWAYVNKNEAERIFELIESYESDCIYGCVEVNQVDCVDNQCQGIVSSSLEGDKSPEALPNLASEAAKIGQKCKSDNDCELPFNYAILSSCPYSNICAEGSCQVACPQVDSRGGEVCEENIDCACDNYQGSDLKDCLCHKGLCQAIVQK